MTRGVATRAKGTYLATKYQRLVRRMNKKKALVAVAHTLLVIGYHPLSRRVRYTELGSDYVDRQHMERQRRRLVEQLKALGVKVTIEAVSVSTLCSRRIAAISLGSLTFPQ